MKKHVDQVVLSTSGLVGHPNSLSCVSIKDLCERRFRLHHEEIFQ